MRTERVGPGSQRLPAAVAVINAAERHDARGHSFVRPLDSVAAAWSRPTVDTHGWVAVDGADRVAGVALATLHTADNRHLVELELVVDLDHRRQGAATALWPRITELARETGRDTILSASAVPLPAEAAWERHVRAVADPAGSAALAAEATPAAAFARTVGAELVQARLRTQLQLPVPGRLLDAAAERVRALRAQYEVITWVGEIPEQLYADRAELGRRMSLDAPLSVAFREKRWDIDRVRGMVADRARRGLRTVGTGAVDRASRRLVAFTEIVSDSRTPDLGQQEETLVAAEHRGRRLATLVKVDNLRALATLAPGVARVKTRNALDNGPMIKVNRMLGFEPVYVVAMWRATL